MITKKVLIFVKNKLLYLMINLKNDEQQREQERKGE